jgi:hypothetical protein
MSYNSLPRGAATMDRSMFTTLLVALDALLLAVVGRAVLDPDTGGATTERRRCLRRWRCRPSGGAAEPTRRHAPVRCCRHRATQRRASAAGDTDLRALVESGRGCDVPLV